MFRETISETIIMDNIKYIYHLPFSERSEFCKIMNQNDKWEELAGMLAGNLLKNICFMLIYLVIINLFTCFHDSALYNIMLIF